jgi:flagellin-like protein
VTSPLSFLFNKKVMSSRNPTIKSNKISRRQRRGISPVIATTIILAITIVLGLALWQFANSGVSNASIKYSEAVEDYGNIVRNHRYVIANVDLDSDANTVAFWIYNNGKIDATISENPIIVICKKDKDGDCVSPIPDSTTLCQHNPSDITQCLGDFTVPSKSLRKFSINMSPADPSASPPIGSIESGKTYEITVLSDAGLAQTYVKKSD